MEQGQRFLFKMDCNKNKN